MANLPKVVIVYGPPLAGKGTQGAYLKELLPDYYHLDFGTQLRKYVTENFESSNKHAHSRAIRLKERMDNGQAVLTEDLRYVIEDGITQAINQGTSLLVEGPGRLLEEARWLSNYLHSKNLSVTIFHLHSSLEETLTRAQRRWYAPNINVPFIGYESAKAQCKPGEKPYQRVEDTDPKINIKRYKELYENQYAAILQEYQLNSRADVLTIDGSKSVDEVSQTISKYLKIYYGF